MQKITLLAEVLASGNGCPVCGGQKTEPARTCRWCFRNIGHAAAKAVDEVIATCAKAEEGNTAAVAGKYAFQRKTIFGPILAQVKIDRDAQLHKAHGKIGAFWDCSKSVDGGFASVYIFGATEDQRDKMVTALIYFKAKEHRPNDWVSYFRAQVVPPAKGINVISDVKLQLLRQEDADSLIPGLPVQLVEEGKRRYAVGFQYVGKEDRQKNELFLEVADSLLTPIFKQKSACA